MAAHGSIKLCMITNRMPVPAGQRQAQGPAPTNLLPPRSNVEAAPSGRLKVDILTLVTNMAYVSAIRSKGGIF